MQHFFRLPLSVASAAALALASTPIQPVAAQEDGSAADLNASVGYYYQQGDLNEADGSGVKGRLAYNISNGLTLGANLSYDEAFDTRFTDDIKYRFGSNGYGTPSIASKNEKENSCYTSCVAEYGNDCRMDHRYGTCRSFCDDECDAILDNQRRL